MPAGLAAAYVYISSVLFGEHIPPREIAKSADITEVTLRYRCKEILEKFVIRQKLVAFPVKKEVSDEAQEGIELEIAEHND